jgi:thioredoxin 1
MKELIVFTASWCKPCQALKQTINTSSLVSLNIPIKYVDIDSDTESVLEYQIRSVPTLILKDQDTVLKRHSGALSVNDLLKFVE